MRRGWFRSTPRQVGKVTIPDPKLPKPPALSQSSILLYQEEDDSSLVKFKILQAASVIARCLAEDHERCVFMVLSTILNYGILDQTNHPTLSSLLLSETITPYKLKVGSLTTIQSVYIDEMDPYIPFDKLGKTCVVLSFNAEVYPNVNPFLSSSSAYFDKKTCSKEHIRVAQGVLNMLQRYKEVQDIVCCIGLAALPREDRLTFLRARKVERYLSQPTKMTEKETGLKCRFVTLYQTILTFGCILDGRLDRVAEGRFFMIGCLGIDLLRYPLVRKSVRLTRDIQFYSEHCVQRWNGVFNTFNKDRKLLE
jgi:hypothetical protein